jgi:hypothetical protein
MTRRIHNHACLHDRMKNLSKEPLRCPNRSQFGTGLAWMLYKHLSVLFYCAIDRYHRSTGVSFCSREGYVPTRSWSIHCLRLSIDIAYVSNEHSGRTVFAASAAFKQEDSELLTSFRDKSRQVPSSTHLVSLVFMIGILFSQALSFCPRTLISKMFIHDSTSLPYIGCLPLQYLLSNPRSRVEQLRSC